MLIINYANNAQLADNVSTVENRLRHDKCLIACEQFITEEMWGWRVVWGEGGDITLNWKCHHFNEIIITSHFDNVRCSQWWKFHQNAISVVCEGPYMYIFYIFLCFSKQPFSFTCGMHK